MTDAPNGRPSGRWRRPGPWLIAALILGAAAVPGGLASAHLVRVAPVVGVARPAVASVSFATNLTDAPAFQPRYLNATVGGAVAISVHLDNVGAIPHTFTLANQSGVVLNRSWAPKQLTDYFTTNASLINVSVAGGASAWANFSLPAATTFRSFEFVSTIPYQFQAGMWGFLNLTPTGPTLTLSENTTNSLSFVPNVLSAGTNFSGSVTLHVLVSNLGSDVHTFTVSSQPNVSLSGLANLSKFPPLVNVTVSPAPASVWANFTVSKAGVYEYVCTEPGHFAGGMFGFLYVGVPVPPPPTPPSSAIVEVPILVGSAVLLAIGVGFALASAFVGRVPKRPAEHGPSH